MIHRMSVQSEGCRGAARSDAGSLSRVRPRRVLRVSPPAGAMTRRRLAVLRARRSSATVRLPAVTATALAAAGDLDGAGAILGQPGGSATPGRRARRLLRPRGPRSRRARCGPATRPGSGWPRSSGARPTGSRPPRPAARGRRALAARPPRRRSRLAGLRPGARRARRLVGLDGAQPRGPRVLRRAGSRGSPAGAARRSTGCPRLPPASWPAALPRRSRASTTRSTPRCSSADGASFRQGVGDDARPLDVQAFGILWLIGRDRHADARGGRADGRRDDARRGPPRRLAGRGRPDVQRLSAVRRRVEPGRAVDGGDADDAPGQGAARAPTSASSTTAPTAGPR